MDAKNFEYLSKKIDRYGRLDNVKDKLNQIQQLLVKDHSLKIQIDCDGINYCVFPEKLPPHIHIEEYDDLMREIKDNLIDAIGMKIIEIEDKMKEL